MWLCFELCSLALLTLCHVVYGGIGDEMSEAIQLCCNEGTRHAKNNTLESCSETQPIPSGVLQAFSTLCVMARTQCCREYYQKKQDCDAGIDIAMSSRHCGASKDSMKACCNDCVRGHAMGLMSSLTLCTSRPGSTSAEKMLSDEAYARCCKKGAQEKKKNTSIQESSNSLTVSKRSDAIASVCEDYAPNELCAHHCIPVPGSYRCECNPGFKLMSDGRNCIEVVRNRCKPRNPCQHKCNDNGVEVKCSCRRGYELMPDGKSCQDIDECALEMPVCLANTKCYNIQGSYKCIPIKHKAVEKGNCPPGFARNVNNHLCDDINECKLPNPPCPSYLCENTIGAYKCGGVTGDPANLSTTPRSGTEERCPTGFQLGHKGECEDVDECAVHKDDCNAQSQFCINTQGSFYCQDKTSRRCPPGFKIDTVSGKCEDIDECEDVSDICRQDEICVNQLGQYDCKPIEAQTKSTSKHECPDGMRIKAGVCEDIDECVEGTHLCDLYQHCLNTNGSYECHCKLGYEQDITTGACVDVNECATGQHDCIIGSQRCDNTIGSFLCIRIASCGTGYILHHSTGKCEDIDECALGTHNCVRAGTEYQCMNILGSFRCVRRRTSTTSTTLAPEYEYEYYDSEEEVAEGNQTVSTSTTAKPQEATSSASTTTTTTSAPKSTSADPVVITTTESVTKITTETNPDDTFNYIIPPSSKEPNIFISKDDNIIPSIPEPEITYTETERSPETTKPTVPEISNEVTGYERPTTAEEPDIIYSEPKPGQKTKEFDPTVPEYVPYSPETNSIPESTEADPKQSTPDKNDKGVESEISNNIDAKPAPTERTEGTYRPQKPDASPPAVYVNVDKNTESTDAGNKDQIVTSVVNTTSTSQNKWTKIDTKPVDCPIGFENDEYGACFDIDECATNHHSCSGLTETCRNTIGGYVCDCAPGFRKDLNTGVCDIVTTSSSSSTTSTTTTTTTTTTTPPPPSTTEKSNRFFWGYPDYRQLSTRPFRPRNQCDAGFYLNPKTGSCDDVNECTNGQANCAEVEICVNTAGGYRCECPPNWRLDAIRHRCVPNRNNGQFPPGYGNIPSYTVNSKEMVAHGEKGTKSVTPKVTQIPNRGLILQCKRGYRLSDDNTCQDIDECSTGEAKCGPVQLCTNLPGGYVCSCPRGHKIIEDNNCQDIDECSLAGEMPICSHNADCVNTIGSYQCKCHKGFRSAPVNDKVCVNVDECAESRPGTLCEHRCNDVWGGYRCSCHRGYRIKQDNRTCADVNECLEFQSKMLCVGQCLNVPGSYRCACPSGYRLAEDRRSCIDIDECATGEAACSRVGVFGDTSNVCVNTRGSYRCHRIICPMGYRLVGKHRCNKVEHDCGLGDWNCAHQPSTISYNYITFVSKLYIPDDKVKLFTMRGPTLVYAKMKFQLRIVDVNAPPSVRDKADISAFLLQQDNNEAVMSLVRPLEGPQSIELELSMELYNRNEFGGIAIARLFIHVSEYEY